MILREGLGGSACVCVHVCVSVCLCEQGTARAVNEVLGERIGGSQKEKEAETRHMGGGRQEKERQE